METADVVVIGGGVMGTSIAFNLARRRAGRVVLLEKNTVCSGTSAKSSAIVRTHYTTRPTAADGAPGPRHLRALGRRGGRRVRLRAHRHALRRARRRAATASSARSG